MVTTVAMLLAEVPDLAGHEARRLVLFAAQQELTWMVGDPEVDADTTARFRSAVARRRRGEPLQYIEGTAQFGPIELLVDSRALIPRPETERLWEIAVDLIKDRKQPVVVDLCTGSGNLALALKYARADASVVACDVSPEAISLAAENAARLGLEVLLFRGDLFGAIPGELRGGLDLIVSNPPYVARSEFEVLPEEVKNHEPTTALVAAEGGLAVLSRIAEEAASWLRPGGVVICEIGETQGERCRHIFSSLQPQIEPDLAGRDRFVVGSAPMRPDVH